MSFLAKLRKKDLEYVALELGEEVRDKSKVVELISLIKKSKNYDEEIILGLISNINDDRQAKEAAEEQERKEKLEEAAAERERKEKFEAAERERKEKLEEAAVERKREAEERRASREHELALKKLEIEAANANSMSPITQVAPILQTSPKIDWQTQDDKEQDSEQSGEEKAEKRFFSHLRNIMSIQTSFTMRFHSNN